jgi:hypothetical protein
VHGRETEVIRILRGPISNVVFAIGVVLVAVSFELAHCANDVNSVEGGGS